MQVTMNDLCEHLRNFFEREEHKGTYSVENGTIGLPFLVKGQYFRIVGSILNDGVYRYPCQGLADETFDGEIWALAVPPSLNALLAEINEWQAANGERANAPFNSESFAGYSYSKATDPLTGGAVTWQSTFRSALNNWRKI